jgi:hypothetical protein
MKPDAPDARTVVPGREVPGREVPGREVTYHESSPAEARKRTLPKSVVAHQADPRRDVAVANAVLDVLRDSSLSESEAIELSKRVMKAITEGFAP